MTACNYDSEALADDGSCEYPAEFYNCDGCINDTDGDGVCDELKYLVVLTQQPVTTTLMQQMTTNLVSS